MIIALVGHSSPSRYLLEHVLRQYGYEQTILRPPMPYEGGVLPVIDDKWLHFPNHIVTCVTFVSLASACVVEYM